MKKKICLLASVLAVTICGCGTSATDTNKTVDLMKEAPIVGAETPDTTELPLAVKEENLSTDAAITDFALRLFRESYREDQNTLISPVSVLSALSMTANGAKENTLSQMENTFGVSVAELNAYLHHYISQLPNDENNKLHIANSIWFKDVKSFTVESDFLQVNQDYYDAGLFKASFDEKTLKDINAWVEEHTDGMIQNILDKIPDDAVMYLINALAFDAEWQNTYEDYNVADRTFTREDGTTQDVELMYSDEYSYLETQNAKGFLKYYKNQKYAFVALLPEEDLSLKEYIASLSGEELYETLQNPLDVPVNTAIPKFQSEYSIELSEVLKVMGMTDAFDWQVADFTGIGSSAEGNLVIDRVLHKTFIEVGEQGTKAGAATVVEIVAEGCAAEPEEVKEVILDRPFLYMIIDCENGLPLFMGTVSEIEN